MIDSTDKDNVSMTNDLSTEGTGMSTPQTSMMMASFRVDREVWAKFGAIAKRERLSATDVLTDYIQRCADNDKTEYAVRIDTDNALSTDTYDTDKFNEAVTIAVSTLSLCSRDDVSTMINTAIHKASIGNNDTHGNTKRIDVLTTGSTEVQRELAQINSAIGEVEACAKSQFATMREELKELKKPLAIGR